MDATETPTPTAEEAAQAAYATAGIDPATGFATDGEWPINGRLRAEAMAAKGVATDPAGIVSDDMIAATGTRVAAEEKEAADAAKDLPSLSWTKPKLLEHASKLGLAVETDANKAAILDAITAAPAAAPTQEG